MSVPSLKSHAKSIDAMLRDANAAFEAGDWQRAHTLWLSIVADFGRRQYNIGTAALTLSVCKRLNALSEQIEAIAAHGAARGQTGAGAMRSRRIVIYSAVTGRYDSVKVPEIVDARFDYVLFSDSPVSGAGLWQVRPVTAVRHSAVRDARYVKMHPHKLLADYEIAVWVDANIMLVGDLYPFLEDFFRAPEPVAAIPHPHRRTIYEEFFACVEKQKDAIAPMREQIARYRRQGFEHDDLVEANVLMFKLRDPRLPIFLHRWWYEMERGSRRDQLGFNYALAQAGTDWHRLMPSRVSARNHPVFALVPHDRGQGPAQALVDAIASPAIDPYEGPSYAASKAVRLSRIADTSIGIVIYNNSPLPVLRRCVESLVRSRGSARRRIVIIDDAAEDPVARGLADIARPHSSVTLARIDRRRGYAGSVNMALADAREPFVILLGSSAVVTDFWAEKMADAVCSTPGAGLVGPLSNAGAAGRRPAPGRKRPRPVDRRDLLNAECEDRSVDGLLPRIPALGAFCLGIRRDLTQAIGLFDETTFPDGPGCDVDYCFRAADAGFDAIVATHTFVHDDAESSYDHDDRALLDAAGRSLSEKHCKRRLARAAAAIRDNPIIARLFAKSTPDARRDIAIRMPQILARLRRPPRR